MYAKNVSGFVWKRMCFNVNICLEYRGKAHGSTYKSRRNGDGDPEQGRGETRKNPADFV